jgi:hypothetical protein
LKPLGSARLFWFWLALPIALGAARAGEPGQALTVRLIRPDRQLEQLLALFQGARAPHPAAALTYWKQATHERTKLRKPAEAVIALFNPEMVGELRALDASLAVLGLDPGDGRIVWRASVPKDDGTFAALATALTLSDGGSAPPLNGLDVDRLGPPGSPLMAQTSERRIAVASSRDGLRAALEESGHSVRNHPALESGCVVRLDPHGMTASGPVWCRRLGEALRASGCRVVDGVAALNGETFSLTLTSQLERAPSATPPLRPDWLDWAPAAASLAVVAVAFDPRPEAWDSAFALVDRVERADPARADVAPLRARVNLLASAAGIHPETDLWPHLRGLSAGILVDPQFELAGAWLALHADTPKAAQRLGGSLIPRVAAALSGAKPVADAEAAPDAMRSLGRYAGRPLTLAVRGGTVLVGWGESALPACLDAQANPRRSAAAAIRASWDAMPLRSAGAFWPGRLRSLALADASPALWLRHHEGATIRDDIRWPGLRGVVRGFLDRLPLEPPPDH